MSSPKVLQALQVVANCVPDELGGTTLGSYEMGLVREALAELAPGKFVLFLVRPTYGGCGYLSEGEGLVATSSKARRFNTTAEASAYAVSRGWNLSTSVPASGTNAYVCEVLP